jgi:hypothetical protein
MFIAKFAPCKCHLRHTTGVSQLHINGMDGDLHKNTFAGDNE